MIPASVGSRGRVALTMLFALVALAALGIRVSSIAEPLGIDQSLWASAARGLSRGQRLYRDVWEQRPPGIYWIYLWGFRLLGWRTSTVAWTDILASATTCVFLAAIARRLANGLAAALAAAIFAALTMPSWLYGYGGFLERSVCETFILPLLAISAWAVTRVAQDGSRFAAAVAGLAAGMMVVLKPNAGLYLPALLVWLALYGVQGRRLQPAAIAVLASAVMPVVALAWLWRLGLLHDARVAVIDFNRYYVSEGFAPAAYVVQFSKAVFLRMKTDPLWLSGTAGTVAAAIVAVRRRALPPLPALGVIWGAAAVIVIVVNGARLFNSYFMNGLPPLTLMAAWLFTDGWRQSRVCAGLAVAAALLSAVLVVHRGYVDRVLGWARTNFAQLTGPTDETAYLERFGSYANGRGYSARANAELADYVRRHTTPDDRIFLFGISGAGVYFLSDRLPAHRFVRVNFFVGTEFPDPAFRLESVVKDLQSAPPAYLIFEQLPGQSLMPREANNLPHDSVMQPLLQHYRQETRIEDFTLYRLEH